MYYQHSYLQWIAPILIFYAFLSYVPRFVWKYCLEQNRIKQFCESVKSLVREMVYSIIRTMNFVYLVSWCGQLMSA